MESGFAQAAKFNRSAPSNYVAGLGRGAIGFTTRSDIGPARALTEAEIEKAKAEMAENTGEDFDEGKALFMTAVYDKDDKEADDIYEAVDEVMDSRRKVRREKMEEEQMNMDRKKRPNIHDQFHDLKRSLSVITPEQWAAIPEIGDYSVKHKKARQESFTPAPDTLLEAARKERENTTGSIDVSGQASVMQGADLTTIGKAQTTLLGHKLDKAAGNVHGQSTVNPRAYMDDLSTLTIASDSDISDYKKARALLKSVRETNPSHAPGWVASARLEEVAGRMVAARTLIDEGCKRCNTSEDVWLEASRLHTPENAKTILARAVKQIPDATRLWVRAAELEGDNELAKKRVLRKALEVIPNSVMLWKAAVDLETPEDARIMLRRGVECCPTSVDLWLALAKLEKYEEARKVLNKARQHIPNDVSIWITASQLEETNGKPHMCDKIVSKAIETMQKQQVMIDRSEWLKHATECEAVGNFATAKAIVKQMIPVGVDAQDRRRTWMDDADSFLSQGYPVSARAVYEVCLDTPELRSKKSVWEKAVELERKHGEPEAVIAMLERATQSVPKARVMWLMWAKECWKNGDVDKAREVLATAFNANRDSEEIWLAAVKLENENDKVDDARRLLNTARERCGTERVWMKSAKLERELNNLEEAEQIARKGLEIHPSFDRLWLIAAQVNEQMGRMDKARELYMLSVRRCPDSIACWKCLADYETRSGNVSTARSFLEKARVKNPQNPELWKAAVLLEKDSGNMSMAGAVLAKALQDSPKSGQLLALSIEMAPRPQKRSKSMDALKLADDAHVITAVAKVFWMERKLEKARKWFKRAVNLNPDLGDAWATAYKFEVQEGTEATQAQLIEGCKVADPRHGDTWCSVSKATANARLNLEQILVKAALVIE